MMNKTTVMKDAFALREIYGEHLLVPVGDTIMHFQELIPLNDVETFFWSQILLERSEDQIVDSVLNRYDVKRNVVEMDLSSFLEKLGAII